MKRHRTLPVFSFDILNARFSSLDDWLTWLETAHNKKIDLGLTRIRQVAERMNLLSPSFPVITVAGTNGKGSSVAMLESILSNGGFSVGSYTSPHIHRYNERIRIAGEEASDAAIVAAFAAIDEVRGEISLSYFEFGTLAALQLFKLAAVDLAILEIGLGGRLDASNIIDADVALITSIDIDHTDWLGNTREEIALEKAAIARAGRPVVCGDLQPPENLRGFFSELGADYYQSGVDFQFQNNEKSWDWQGFGDSWESLPLPAMAGVHQISNAAAVIAVCHLLPEQFCPDRQTIEKSLGSLMLSGRFERIPAGDQARACEVVFDVAHNPAGISALAKALANHPVSGKTLILFGAMADKDLSSMLEVLNPLADQWVLTAPEYERALSANELTDLVADILPDVRMATYQQVPQAMDAALQLAEKGDRLVVTGSFYTVAEAREYLMLTAQN